jgi:non-specific serine/threonine protein kinase
VTDPREAESAAARLRRLRSSLGLSQEQLARQLGVSFATVNRWESGRTQPSARAQSALAQLETRIADRASAPSARARGTTLPVARSSFVGRERELTELTGLIRDSRLVTLLGPGGAGKSRLAAEVIRRSFPTAPVVFLALEQIRPPLTLTLALASRLQVHDQVGTPLTESIKDALATTPRLLLLDGAEQIAGQVADLASELLVSVPGLTIVVTSRVLLHVPGEVCWTVPPLACPSVAAGASDIAASDAVKLFVARAGERLPGFRASDVAPHAIAELCRRLDGLPLAIELIAGWVGTLSIREILQQRAVLLNSESFPAGQHGGRRLADVLQVSYDLLAPEQQRSLAELSVLTGPFRLDDVQAVLGLDAQTAATTTRLLVDSSWLLVTRTSEQNLFSMLDTIRTFAAAALEKTGDGTGARRRHALHWAAIAAASEQGLGGPDAPDWTSRLESAVADLHEALSWAAENGEIDLGLQMSASLWQWWLISGRLAVGRNWLARFLALAGPRTDESTGRALCAAAVLAAENGDYAAAIEAAEQSMTIFGPLGLKRRMALAATVVGSAHRYLGNTDAARVGFQTAMDLRVELGDRRGVAISLNNLAVFEIDDGNLPRARELIEQALGIKREIGEDTSIAFGLTNLADVLIKSGDWDEAELAVAESATLAGANPQLTGIVRCNQGLLAEHRRDWAEAEEHFRAAIATFQAGGHPHDLLDAMINLGRVCHQSGQRTEALRQLRGAEALATDTGNAQRLADAKAALAEVTGDSGTPTAPVNSHFPGRLTRRQAEVLQLLAAGHSNKQIAANLFVSPATVERHLATIYRKLGLGGRVDAARYAVEHGLARHPDRAML